MTGAWFVMAFQPSGVQAQSAQGGQGTGPAGVEVVPGADNGPPAGGIIPWLAPAGEAALDAAKASAAVPLAAALTAPPAAPAGLDTPGSSQLFLPPNANDEANSGNFIPSDGALAADKSYVVQVNNSRITVLNPATGAPIAPFPEYLYHFFGASSSDLIGDIRALYDAKNKRWLVTAEDFTANKLLLNASQSADPTAGWWHYSIGMDLSGRGLSGDFPTLGQTTRETGDTEGGIYLGWNEYSASGFVDCLVMILPKSKIYTGAGYGYQYWYGFNSGGTTFDTLQPANVMNLSDRPEVEYLMNTYNINFGGSPGGGDPSGLVVWAIKDGVPAARHSSSLTGLGVGTASYAAPPNAPEPGLAGGRSDSINTGDCRISGELTYCSGNLYASANDTYGVRIWTVRPYLTDAQAITSATLLNDIAFGTGGFAGGAQAFYGTPQPDSEGNVTLVYSFSGPTTYPSACYLSYRVSEVPGALHDSGYFLEGGQAYYYQLDQYGRNRWGDYNAAAPAELSANTTWFEAQYSESSGAWGTAIGKNAFGAPDQR